MTDEEARFSIVYDGEAIVEGTIDAKELAPALLALADLFDEARPLVPHAPQVSLRVCSGFERGSFEVYLELAKLYDQLVGLFSRQEASAWSNFFQIIGISGATGIGIGLLQLIKRGKGRKPTAITIEHTERVKIIFEGDAPLEVERSVWELFNNLRVRKAVERIVQPLRGRGIDTFKIRHQGRESLDVKQDEVGYFDAPTEHEGEVLSLADTRLMLVAPSFQEGNKWRVSDGSRTIYVAIEDADFVRAVQTGTEAFRKGDILHVKLQTRQWMEGAELKAEHSIVQVHSHHSAPEQQKLPLDQDKESGAGKGA